MMEHFIQKVVASYPKLVAEEAMFEKHLETRENPDMRDALTTIKVQLGMIESWFALLNVEERVIFRQVLSSEYNATPTTGRIAETRWAYEHLHSSKVLLQFRDSAFQKIIHFSETHSRLTNAIFQSI